MRIKVCHARCEHCGHADVPDLDLQLHQSADGVFSTAAVCRDEQACHQRKILIPKAPLGAIRAS